MSIQEPLIGYNLDGYCRESAGISISSKNPRETVKSIDRIIHSRTNKHLV